MGREVKGGGGGSGKGGQDLQEVPNGLVLLPHSLESIGL